MQNDNCLTIGPSGLGKTTRVLRDILDAAERGYAVVTLDPHTGPGSLAFQSLAHLAARGFEHRVLYERLSDFTHPVLPYDFLPASQASNPLVQLAQNEHAIRTYTESLIARRRETTLGPLTEEGTMTAGYCHIYQPDPRPSLTLLHHTIDGTSPRVLEFATNCQHSDTRRRLLALHARGGLRQYDAARRLIQGVTTSPPFMVRCGKAGFSLTDFLAGGGIFLVEGGSRDGSLSQDAMTVMLKTIGIQTIDYIKNRKNPYPRVLFVIDEAMSGANLADDAIARFAGECRKFGGILSVINQTATFGSSFVTDSLFTNCPTHRWFLPADSNTLAKAVSDCGDPSLKDSFRRLGVGECMVKSHSKIFTERFKPPEDLWTLPGLLELKAEEALKRIRQRSEYQTPHLPNEEAATPTRIVRTPSPATAPATGKNAAASSPSEEIPTSASPDTSSTSSAAARLRRAIERFSDSGTKGS